MPEAQLSTVFGLRSRFRDGKHVRQLSKLLPGILRHDCYRNLLNKSLEGVAHEVAPSLMLHAEG